MLRGRTALDRLLLSLLGHVSLAQAAIRFPSADIPVATLVGTHVGALAEDTWAKRAGIRLLPCVEALMGHQVGFLRKALWAAAASVRLLPRVDAEVGHQIGLAPELLGTHRADERAINGQRQGRLGRRQGIRQWRDGGTTLGAGHEGINEGAVRLEHLYAKGVYNRMLGLEGFPVEGVQEMALRERLPGVDLLVGDEVRLVSEALATLATDIRFLPSVDMLVGSQVGLAAKRFATLLALVATLAGVHLPVGQQVGLVPKALATLGAGIRPVSRQLGQGPRLGHGACNPFSGHVSHLVGD